VLNWNRPLLLALGKPSYPLLVAIALGMVEILLILWWVPAGGYLAMAAILSAYLAVSVSITAWRGWRIIHKREAADDLSGQTESGGAVL
jgi:O-antigen/teichoic acid export membrane protein